MKPLRNISPIWAPHGKDTINRLVADSQTLQLKQSVSIYEKGSYNGCGNYASAPTIAAIIAHLNEVRLSQGKPVLGFLNPWIYSTGFKGFTDITHEGSIGCLGTSMYSKLPTRLVPYASWNATKGWDPVTGFASKGMLNVLPNFGHCKYLIDEVRQHSILGSQQTLRDTMLDEIKRRNSVEIPSCGIARSLLVETHVPPSAQFCHGLDWLPVAWTSRTPKVEGHNCGQRGNQRIMWD
ncbi:tripeptidyl peptidase SED3 [Coccidioides immitis RMSCC 3703]|uniref:Tripeptidyl peptidase SED3 n=1 Tax=Coccidioides immitis RMSCC 3703 TaxID=454286 RepID=A0A0J8QUM7_COCIT|nr:tripeptidyl peptidase SED3 [Coccidioides immitis RMSCC 3703]